MATVCGTSMSMMDAGVPLEKPIAGIAMGLIKENDNYVGLSDIIGVEAHLADMDFKVAGTKDGINSLQKEIKIKKRSKFHMLNNITLNDFSNLWLFYYTLNPLY